MMRNTLLLIFTVLPLFVFSEEYIRVEGNFKKIDQCFDHFYSVLNFLHLSNANIPEYDRTYFYYKNKNEPLCCIILYKGIVAGGELKGNSCNFFPQNKYMDFLKKYKTWRKSKSP